MHDQEELIAHMQACIASNAPSGVDLFAAMLEAYRAQQGAASGDMVQESPEDEPAKATRKPKKK